MNELKMFRLKNRIKQQELAQVSGIHPSLLSKIENNWDKLTKKQATSVVKAYNTLGVEGAKSVVGEFIKESIWKP